MARGVVSMVAQGGTLCTLPHPQWSFTHHVKLFTTAVYRVTSLNFDQGSYSNLYSKHPSVLCSNTRK